MQPTRPVFLDVRLIKLPVTGIVSILHRVSGLVLVLAIPAAALLLHRALSGPEGFAAVSGFLGSWPMRLGIPLLLWSLVHHLLAGIRFLLLDLGIGLDLAPARLSAWIALSAAVATTLILLVLAWSVTP